MKIETGLFAGTEIPASSLRPIIGADNHIVVDPLTNKERLVWPAINRTPLFLEKFSPFAGWAVEVSSEPSEYPAWDKHTDSYGNAVSQPTRLYTARLLKDGRVFATASVLVAVFSTWAIRYGEDLARGALYDALGLSIPDALPDNDGKDLAPLPKPKVEGASNDSTDAPASTTDSPAKAPLPPSVVVVPVVKMKGKPAPSVTPQPTENRPGPRNQDSGGIDPNIKANIDKVAADKGFRVPALTDNQHAKQILLDMLAGKGEPIDQEGAA
jgi:hypothetical protein